MANVHPLLDLRQEYRRAVAAGDRHDWDDERWLLGILVKSPAAVQAIEAHLEAHPDLRTVPLDALLVALDQVPGIGPGFALRYVAAQAYRALA